MSRAQRDHILALGGYASYNAYLQSDIWLEQRAAVMRKAKWRCVCGSKATQVHHKAYTEENLFGKARRHLVALCADCHYGIEFEDGKKNSLGEANRKLKAI